MGLSVSNLITKDLEDQGLPVKLQCVAKVVLKTLCLLLGLESNLLPGRGIVCPLD